MGERGRRVSLNTHENDEQGENGPGNTPNDVLALTGATLPDLPVISEGWRDYSSVSLLKMNRDSSNRVELHYKKQGNKKRSRI